MNLQIAETTCAGADAGRGNLLGIQPWMELGDYASAEQFYAKLAGYFDAARQHGWLGPRTVVVLPEYLGTWLVAADEPAALYRSTRMDRAMARLALRHAGPFGRAWLAAPSRDRARYALFRARAAHMAEIYQNVFAELARGYGVTIVAGSIVLPGPRVVGGRLISGTGELLNVSVVYQPNGMACGELARKFFPTEYEQPFIGRPAAHEPPVFDTPAGRLAVLVCADAFYPASYAALTGRGACMLAVPSYLETDGVWHARWPGYNGSPAPADVDARDIGVIAEREAWLKYGMAGRIGAAGIPYGMNVFLRGRLLDLGSDGAAIMVRAGAAIEARHVAGATLANLWME